MPTGRVILNGKKFADLAIWNLERPDAISVIRILSQIMRRSTLAIAILALLPIVVLSVAVPCPQMTLVRKTRTSVAYFIGAGTISVSPYSDGTIYDDNKMMWDMSMLVERNRSLGNADGSFNYPFCVNPSGGHGIALLDPLLPNVPGEPCPGTYGTGSVCGIVTSYLLVKDMMCDVQEVTEPFYGFTRESVYVTMTHPAYPEFKLVAGHHLVNGSVNVYPLANNTWVVNRYMYVQRLFRRGASLHLPPNSLSLGPSTP